ncbi:MAG: gamma-glutamyltransferase family protein [Burkholderiaceae bacterium]|nr:gamma-glutamyltransferase family protein [Burkholderiaceae bacterium]
MRLASFLAWGLLACFASSMPRVAPAVEGAAAAAAIESASPQAAIESTSPQAVTGSLARAAPEAASRFVERAPVFATRFLAVTASPHATRAAASILEAGGNAVDAAIAAQMVLGLVEPQSSGIGGGAFLLLFDARSGRVRAFDGRETAPARAQGNLFLRPDGTPMDFFEAAVGGRSVGVPGVVRMLERVHQAHGRLAWHRLFEPAITLARNGFEVSERLHALLDADRWLRMQPAAAAYFYDAEGHAWPPGHLLRNEALADTLAQIAHRGSLALHTGPIARDIVDAVARHPNAGVLGERDLAFYEPVEREPLCVVHRRHRVCGMPPPSSGAIAVAQMLAYWRFAGPPVRLADRDGSLLVDGVHRFTEAERLAFADRNEYVADTDFVALPGQRTHEPVRAAPGTLLDGAYLLRRATLIGERSMRRAAPGSPSLAAAPRASALPVFEPTSTSHLSIVDADGNVVSMTTSIENAFGSRLLVRGFLLNNQLTDFSFVAARDGVPVANRVQPGKRPRSSMAPTIVLDARSGAPLLAVGSPGGASIISYVARTLLAVLDDRVELATALAMPNIGSRNGPTVLEADRAAPALATALAARGHVVEWREMTSGLHAIALHCRAPRRCVLEGAVDPRREGMALGR